MSEGALVAGGGLERSPKVERIVTVVA